MTALDKIYTAITTLLDMIGGWVVLPAISILVMIDVVMRYVFNAPFIWTLEFSEWALLLVFLFALPECTRVDGHVRMDLVINYLSDRVRGVLSLGYYGVGIWIFFLLGRHEVEEFQFSYEMGRATEFLGLPIWMHSLALLTTSILMGVFFLLRILERLIIICGGARSDMAEGQ
ncbi:MAG: TRAP transporter small permease [Alphaproteobacteria bacterium]|jgi:TRAP-type C4-dicarboxylate transport system permease small subunit